MQVAPEPSTVDSIAVPVFAVWLNLTNTVQYQNEYETRRFIYSTVEMLQHLILRKL